MQKKYNLHNIRKIYRKTSLKSMDILYFFSVRKMQNYNLFIPPVEFQAVKKATPKAEDCKKHITFIDKKNS